MASRKIPKRKEVVSRPLDTSDGEEDAHNPFSIPDDEQVFLMRDEERKKSVRERKEYNAMSVHEKMEKKLRKVPKVRQKEVTEAELTEEDLARKRELQKVLEPVLAGKAKRAHPKKKENLLDLIGKKREMFLVQMSLTAKREEIDKLERKAKERERKLLEDEKLLEENAQKFDEFLKENDIKAVEAMRRAEAQTKEKSEKVAEIKRLNSRIHSIRTQMSLDEEKLDEWRRYKEFLISLTPEDWIEEEKARIRKEKHEKMLRSRMRGRTAAIGFRGRSSMVSGGKDAASLARIGRKSSTRSVQGDKEDDGVPNEKDIYVDDSELPMYFKDPQQLLGIFAELEESNLALIQEGQELEATLETLRHKYDETASTMETETKSLSEQIRSLELQISLEKEKVSSLETKTPQGGTAKTHGTSIDDLSKKVMDVYQQCGFENDAKLSTLDMLRNIEARLEHLLRVTDSMPPEHVEAAEKAREKERRQRIREDKLIQQKKVQDSRLKRALERAQAPVMKRTGRMVMRRSVPVEKKKAKPKEVEKQDEKIESYQDFFT